MAPESRAVMGASGKTVLAAAAHLLLHLHALAVDDAFGGRGMLRLPVPPQVHLALEGLLAEAAREGLVAGVLAHVGDQVGRLAEGLRADDAFVRLLP
jgi:hypothetical protein